MKILALSIAALVASCGVSFAQQGPDSRTYNSNDFKPRQRYICVIPSPKSSGQSYMNVCRAPAGRVGERCRCANVTGSGTLQLGG